MGGLAKFAYAICFVFLFFFNYPVIACSIHITVKNTASHNIKAGVQGPSGRLSRTHTLSPNGSFTYHATGSMVTCHGNYFVKIQKGGYWYRVGRTCKIPKDDSKTFTATGYASGDWDDC